MSNCRRVLLVLASIFSLSFCLDSESDGKTIKFLIDGSIEPQPLPDDAIYLNYTGDMAPIDTYTSVCQFGDPI